MKIGIIKESKTPPDKRVALTPAHCTGLKQAYPQLKIKVQRSPVRCFQDEDFAKAGIELTDNVNDCDVIFGVKEVKEEMLVEGKTMFFFSHTIKKQPYNRKLLQEVIRKRVRLIDYECLTYRNGFRMLGFGRYAGIVGSYNALIAYGLRQEAYEMKPAWKCHGVKEMHQELKNLSLGNAKIVISGGGKAARGAKETIEAAGIEEVSITEFLNKEFDGPVYCNADLLDYHELNGRPPASFEEFIEDSTVYENTFMKFIRVADIFISAHFWDGRSARFFTEDDLKRDDFNVKVIADITCDIKGSVPTTLRPSTIESPIYGFNRYTGEESDPFAENSITVMAVDNLPCEIPKDASSGFGSDLVEKILPLLIDKDPDNTLERATIARNGKLTEHFSYLQDFVDGK